MIQRIVVPNSYFGVSTISYDTDDPTFTWEYFRDIVVNELGLSPEQAQDIWDSHFAEITKPQV